MIALALAVQAATPVPAAPVPAATPAPEADVVVLARRVREWKGTFRANANGVSRECRTTHSTGDRAIDAIGCSALVDCYVEFHPRVAAIMAERQPRRQADARVAAMLQAEMTPCLDRRYEPAVAALAATRRAAGAAR